MSGSRTHDEEAAIVAALERRYTGPKAFRAMSAPIWRAGSLSEKDKHLVAVAIAQITRCGFCIEHHAAAARQCGASEAEALAVSYLSAALEAIGDAQISTVNGRLVIADEDALRDTEIAQARQRFAQTVFDDEVLNPAFVWVVAAAIAYAQKNDAHRLQFHELALAVHADRAALVEAYAIVAVLRAGAVYAHTLHVVEAFRVEH